MEAQQLQFLSFRVHRYRDGDAYTRLYEEYAPMIRRFLAAKLGRKEDVDELAAEVFLRAWEYMTANPVDNPQAFFFKIAHNLLADFYRKGDRTEVLTDVMEASIPSHISVADDAMRDEEARALVEKMKLLREDYRQVLQLKYFSEMTVIEIADTLTKTPNAVRILLFRAKRAMKKL